jgi:hypothetical protein
MKQELSGDDVRCDVCQSIFDCRNEAWAGIPSKSPLWVCANCDSNHTEEELLATFEEEV